MQRIDIIFLVPLFLCTGLSLSARQNNEVLIKIRMEDTCRKDTFYLVIYDHYLNDQYCKKTIKTAIKDKSGNYRFNIEGVTKPAYISLAMNGGMSSSHYMLKLYIVEPGDNINLKIGEDKDFKLTGMIYSSPYYYPVYDYYNYKLTFTGKGAKKYQCRYDIDKEVVAHLIAITMIGKDASFPDSDYADICEAISRKRLLENSQTISKNILALMCADLISAFETERISWLGFSISNQVTDSGWVRKVLHNYDIKLRSSGVYGLNEDAKRVSVYYTQFAVAKALLEARLYGPDKKYNELKVSYTGLLRDKILTLMVLKSAVRFNAANLLGDALNVVHTGYLNEKLADFADKNSTGKPAFDFSLPDTSGKIVRLSDFEGKVVFMDFWYNGCGGCAAYYQTVVSKVEREYKNDSNIVFITVNVDMRKERWLQGIRGGRYTSDEVINLFTEGKATEHPIVKRYDIRGYPQPLLIDRKGKIFSRAYADLRYGGAYQLTQIINRALSLKN